MGTQTPEPTLEVKGAAAHEHAALAGTPPSPPLAADNDHDAPVTAQSDPATAGMSIKRPAPDHDHDDGRAAPPEEVEDSQEARARADKKRKVLEENKAAQRKRGNRMFGMMLGTLQRAKKQVEQVEDSGAGKKRAQLQERLREKLDAERKEAIEKTEREKEMRELRAEIARREDEITAAESIVSSFGSPLRRGARFSPSLTFLSLALFAVPDTAQYQAGPRRLPLHEFYAPSSASHDRRRLGPVRAAPPARHEPDRPARVPPDLLPPLPTLALARRPHRRPDRRHQKGGPARPRRVGKTQG